MNYNQQKKAAQEFAARWAGKGDEKQDSQRFWFDLLQNVYGVDDPASFLRFEQRVKLSHTSFIDVMIPATHTMIEQKSLGKDLNAPIKQSDGTFLTPGQQARRYAAALPYSERPRWIISCNFAEFQIYDMERPNDDPERIALKNLGEECYRLQFMVDVKSSHITREMDISRDAGTLVGKLYNALLPAYGDNPTEKDLQDLNKLIVRLVFCLYAEDAGIFGRRNMFHDFLLTFNASDVRLGLMELFKVLDQKTSERDRFLDQKYADFPYVNGSLFSESVPVPPIAEETRRLLIDEACNFDWAQISPTIFGAIFESTLNPDTRRKGGMHYTSIENIHKVIDPLFLNDLRHELDHILEEKVEKQRVKQLDAYREKLSGLTFLDPACGSGNFLTETYLSLRRLENEAIRQRYHGQSFLAFDEANPIKVNINQFYGIEINDFAVTVAATALWISEAQMMTETERIIHHDIDFLPLKTYTNIAEGNALRMDWRSLFNQTTEESETTEGHPHLPDYIMGNPPFIGARMASAEQKQDLIEVFGAKWKNIGNMDYVCGWYKKAADLMRGTAIKTALVSTNSICQGEQVANLWQPLMQDGIVIDFAHRTFRWDSEAALKAHVHCIIVGFSFNDKKNKMDKLIFDNDKVIKVHHINGYLIDGPDVFVDSRSKPLCDVPEIGIGNKPIDGGNYLFEQDEMEEFIKQEPRAEQYFRLWYGAVEFLHQKPRYCLWLGDCSPAELRSMPHCLRRVEAVRETRLASKSEGTRKLADRPTRFHVENMPKGNFIIVPSVSSERRYYVPMGFMPPTVLASNLVLIIPDATLYHFGVLESCVHMAWMRVVCGRLKSDYRYSKDVVYNNFPWPEVNAEQQEKIAQTAQGILDARALYPDSSLADLYDPVTMPSELRKAHRENDRAVMAAYGFAPDMAEPDIVARLFDLYSQILAKR